LSHSWISEPSKIQSLGICLSPNRESQAVKIVQTISLLNSGKFALSDEWAATRAEIHAAVRKAEWPIGSGKFTIYPESGKKSGHGNGVVPIKSKPMETLENRGWTLEHPWDVITGVAESQSRKKGSKPGKIDAVKKVNDGLVVVEWETGNISSSHRAVNKMALGLLKDKCIAGVLVVPNSKFAKYLTDRIGNVEELTPYFPLWQNVNVSDGVLEIIVIEHDDESYAVPKIPKGTDGRSSQGKQNRNSG